MPIEASQQNRDGSETVIFFDWDDTLLPSTFLRKAGLRLGMNLDDLNNGVRTQLREIETSALALLRQARRMGRVYIVTNAEEGWVELSARTFLPGLTRILQEIPVYSARTAFEKAFPDAPIMWKCYMFNQRLARMWTRNTFKNIISLGDSIAEREAIQAVTRERQNTICKSVKFAEAPSLPQLNTQLQLIASNLANVVRHPSDLDLQLTITSNERQQRQETHKHTEQSPAPELDHHRPLCAQQISQPRATPSCA